MSLEQFSVSEFGKRVKESEESNHSFFSRQLFFVELVSARNCGWARLGCHCLVGLGWVKLDPIHYKYVFHITFWLSVYLWLLIKGPFGNVVLVTLFVFFGNTCGWKNVWKYVQYYLKTEKYYLNYHTKRPLTKTST